MQRPKKRALPVAYNLAHSDSLLYRWPGFYDNTVAGGISSGLSILDALIKESDEEAGIDEVVVRKYAKATGALSYVASLVSSFRSQHFDSTALSRLAHGWRQPKIA